MRPLQTICLAILLGCAPVLAGPAPVAPAEESGQVERAKAEITVLVPADAEVFFDGDPTIQKGTERRFVTPPLTRGSAYQYDLRVHSLKDGKPLDRIETVRVYAGDRRTLDFISPGEGDSPLLAPPPRRLP